MNERIKQFLDTIDVNPKIRELAEQSGCSIDRLGFGEGNLEKFAELIVRECMKVSRGADGLDATHEAWYLIKKHFGIKE
jgi:hypothetical protein